MNLLTKSGEDFVFHALRHLGTPRALTAWLLFKHKEWDQLVTLSVDPLHYAPSASECLRTDTKSSALRYARDAQASDLLRKVPFPTSSDRREVARTTWERCEDSCCSMNVWLKTLANGSLLGPEQRFVQFLDAVKKRVTRVLGPVPPGYVGRFGPGTIYEYQGRDGPTALDKLWGITPHCTTRAEPYFRLDYDRTSWSQYRARNGQHHLSHTRGGRLSFVPKDGKTERPISIEPLGNLWGQLGIGAILKDRLEVMGLVGFRPRVRPGLEHLNLPSPPDPQPLHKKLACLGSKTEEWATIDLSSASDTIALELVRWLLPADWFDVLDSLRSPFVKLGKDGPWRRLEKFSSMGNGFTFELETLLFTCILEVACGLRAGRDLFVFGDDIILPGDAFTVAQGALSSCGFSLNPKKSFNRGYFRESCGGDYFSGHNVRSVFIKDLTIDGQALYALHNSLFDRGFPSSVLNSIRTNVPKKLRLFGPPDLGDDVFRGYTEATTKHGMNFFRVVQWTQTGTLPPDRWGDPSTFILNVLIAGSRVARRGGALVPVLGTRSSVFPVDYRLSPGAGFALGGGPLAA